MSTRVLVTDGEQRSALAVVRSLGKAGYHVEVCSQRPHSLAGASRFAAAQHVVPAASDDASGFVDAVDRVCAFDRIDVVLPMTDLAATLMASLRRRRPDLIIPIPSSEIWDLATDKNKLVRLASDLGIPVPHGVELPSPPTGEASLRRLAEGFAYPVVIKPHRSIVPTDDGPRRTDVAIAFDDPSLQASLRDLGPEAYPVLLQERIDGPGLGAFVLAREGEVIAAFAHQRLREKPPYGGVSVVRRSVPLRSDVLEFSSKLLAHLGWTGVAMVEFKEDSRTGAPVLMEINGRFWGSLQLAVDSGIDFPALLLNELTQGTGVSLSGTPYRTGVTSRWLLGDLDHLIWILRAPRSYRRDHPQLPGRLKAIARFMLPWWPGVRYEVLRLTDPRPFITEVRAWVSALDSTT